MQNVEEILQFGLIKDSIKQFTRTVNGSIHCDELTALESEKEQNMELAVLSEMLHVNQYNGLFPIEFSENAYPLIQFAKKGGILSIRDLDMIAEDVLTTGSVCKFILKIDQKCTNILKICKDFKDLTSLEKEIHRVITKSQTIDDRATPELHSIRKEISRIEKTLSSTISSIALSYKTLLSDENVTLRDGHFVIPVKTAYKNKVSGIIHDVSDSGYTTFIEPSEIVELNNKLVSEHAKEQEEIRKILKQLTNLCVLQESEILLNNKILGYIDFVQAKALYAKEIDAIVAEQSKDTQLILRNARHPLLDKTKVVANSFYFNDDKRVVIISGPNAGGKTVALKTVGLCAYMNKCGLAIPCDEAIAPYFEHVYVDIGDSQSISDNLSTFSAHITHIGEITRFVKSKDLVLIDELGTGTDPSEGEAIAIAVVKRFEKAHCLALISSHFSRLKEYAFTSKCIDNASMLFDEDNLSATYIYKQGVPGQSYALDVASRYGLDKEIISEAKKHLDNIKSSDVHSLMNELHKAALDNELKKQELERLKANFDKERKSFEAEKNLLKEKREKLLQDVEKEKESIIENAEETVQEVLKKLNNPNIKQHEVIEVKKEIQNLRHSVETVEYNEKIDVGSYVSVPSLGLSGKVVRISGNKAYLNSDSGMSFNVDIKKLHKIDEPPVKKVFKSNIDSKIKTTVGLELNIIGYHLDEAMAALAKYLDDCVVRNLKQVRIIHGMGSGVLRKATADYLKKCKFVKEFKCGGEYDGGMGATIVVLK